MIRSTELIAANARKEHVRRKRYQNGSLQVVSTHGKRKMWILQYRVGGSKKYHTIGLFSKMSKSDAQQAQAEFMKEVNARTASVPDPHITFGDFLEGVALPFLRSKWKGSTRDTTENRKPSFMPRSSGASHARSIQLLIEATTLCSWLAERFDSAFRRNPAEQLDAT